MEILPATTVRHYKKLYITNKSYKVSSRNMKLDPIPTIPSVGDIRT